MSLIISRNYQNEKDVVSNQKMDSIISQFEKLNNITKLNFYKGIYVPTKDEEFKITENIKCKVINIETDDKDNLKFVKIELTSGDIQELVRFVEESYDIYKLNLQNKLGNKTFYFDHVVKGNKQIQQKMKEAGFVYDKNNKNKDIHFTMNVFSTTRSFRNLFFAQKREFIKRLNFFVNRKDWYYKKGIPYTLGFMFYGEPGCGKTSTIKAIANFTKRHVVNVNLDDITSKTELKKLFFNEKILVINQETNKEEEYEIPISNRIYVIEDIDCMSDIVCTRDNTNDEEDVDSITLSSLLNVLDGTLETPGRIIIITTNHPEKLDKALIRPGRFDMHIHFQKFSKELVKEMIEEFYEKRITKEVAKKLPNYKLSPAEVNAVLFQNFDNIKNAIKELIKN